MKKILEFLTQSISPWVAENIVLAIFIFTLAISTGFYFFQTKQLTVTIEQLESTLMLVTNTLVQTTDQNNQLGDILQNERARNNALENQVTGIASTVETLDKLSKTDKELLQKYSKVYFLNENYVPINLSNIDSQYTYPANKTIQIHTGVLTHLDDMIEAAKANGSGLKIVSGYRSFGTQAALKSSYKVTYGKGANAFSADQGYSEHQLGTAIDFTTESLGADFSSFAVTDQYKWLLQNAYKYGFILSYPTTNTYYQFEPWHWRFVGVQLATKLHDDGKAFYDIDQRVIDEYLVSIFD